MEDAVGLQVVWRMSEGSISGFGGIVFWDQDKWIGNCGFAKTLEQLDLIVWVKVLLADHTLDGRLPQTGDANHEKRPQYIRFVVFVEMWEVYDWADVFLSSETFRVLEMPLSVMKREMPHIKVAVSQQKFSRLILGGAKVLQSALVEQNLLQGQYHSIIHWGIEISYQLLGKDTNEDQRSFV